MTKEQAINYLRSSGFTEEQIKEIVTALDQESMTVIEMYKETVKAVHNQYVGVIRDLEDTIHEGYLSDIIPRFNNVGIADALIIMHTTFDLVCRALKDSCDVAIKVIESKEKSE